MKNLTLLKTVEEYYQGRINHKAVTYEEKGARKAKNEVTRGLQNMN
jgi:hypothetical protein